MAHRIQQPAEEPDPLPDLQNKVGTVDFALAGRRTLFIILFLLMALVYFIVNAEGLRILAPQFGKDLAFGIDLAYPFIFIVLVFTAICTHQIILAFQGLDNALEAPPTRKIFTAFGFAFIAFDAILFYLGATSRSFGPFGSQDVSYAMILLTVVYVMILLGIGYLGVTAFSHKEN